jgi:hypothetical protein
MPPRVRVRHELELNYALATRLKRVLPPSDKPPAVDSMPPRFLVYKGYQGFGDRLQTQYV